MESHPITPPVSSQSNILTLIMGFTIENFVRYLLLLSLVIDESMVLELSPDLGITPGGG